MSQQGGRGGGGALAAIAHISVILLVGAYFARGAWEYVDGRGKIATEGPITNSAHTNGEAAHITFTNLTRQPLYACMRGVVAKKSGGGKVTSVPVCTGDLQPHATITLDAPYQVGAVRDLCSGAPNSLGIKTLDWDLCDFTLEDVPANNATTFRSAF